MDDPPTAFRIEGSAMATGAGLSGTANRFAGFGQPLAPAAELTQGGSPEASAGKLLQHWAFGPELGPAGAICRHAASSASTALRRASTSENASHQSGDVLAGVRAVPICC